MYGVRKLSRIKKGKLLYSAVSSPSDRSKCFTLHPSDRHVHSDTNSTSPGSIQPCCNYCMKTINSHILTLSIASSVITIPNFATRYLGHDAIRIAILAYRVSQCLDLQIVYDCNAIYRPRYTLLSHHNRCRMCWSLTVA